MRTSQKIIIILVTLGLIGGAYGYYMYNKKTPTLDAIPTDIRVSADELYNAFEANEMEALQKFENKILEVEGVIASIQNSNGSKSIIIQAENAMGGGINCTLRDTSFQGVKGDKILIKGECKGYLMDVILNNCYVPSK